MIRKIIASLILFICFFMQFALASAPSLSSIQDDGLGYTSELGDIQGNKSLKDNVIELFFPSASDGGILWKQVRNIAIGIVFIYFLRAGGMFLLNSDDESKIKEAKTNFLYIGYGVFLIFGSVWILGSILNVGRETTTATDTVIKTKNEILGFVLIFLKSAAYYIAFIMMVYYGFEMMKAQEKEDKIKTARTGILNIIIALVAIKVLDYIYYIAQSDSFVGKASDFMTGIATVLGWLLGVIVVIALIYAGFLLVSSRGNEEAMTKSKKIIQNVFLGMFVIFLFIVIIFDLVKNFAI